MNIETASLFLIFLPFLGALVTGLFLRNMSYVIAQYLTTFCVAISFFFAVYLFKHVGLDGEIVHIKLLEWLKVGVINASWAIFIDSLAAVMLIVVTSVSLLVHIFPIGYMAHDKCVPRFMAYISLFTFFMLMLITADNFIQLFFGWEGVGLSSYLLIGFWYHKKSACNASIKAFLVNRVADIGFALGICYVAFICRSVEFQTVFEIATLELESSSNNASALFAIPCILLFIGCMGKSAQFLLHTWLPDAMEGPTPVSALIHAATMVTAGVFMLARCSPIFECSEVALSFITIIGSITCLFAATIALVQDDIKKIIAYSTCSQLGYMFIACGVSAYNVAIFHLMTHAFFKALLFLGAGSVIHAVNGEQDIKKMGGLWKHIPLTYIAMWVGSLAIAGIYPFAGFYSKDAILEAAYASGTSVGLFAYWSGIIAAILTSFYSWRLIILTFHNAPSPDINLKRVHESPLSMLFPLFVLSIGAVFSGYCGVNFGMLGHTSNFWGNSIFVFSGHNATNLMHQVDNSVKFTPLIVGIFGIILAYIFYTLLQWLPQYCASNFRYIHKVLSNKYYFDVIYDNVFVLSGKKVAKFLFEIVDVDIVDSIPNGSASVSKRFAKTVSVLQTGYLSHYMYASVVFLVLLIGWIVFSY